MTEEVKVEQSVNQTTVETNQSQVSQAITNDNFLGSIAEDLRNEPSLKNFKNLNDLAKSYISAQKMIGGSVKLPTQDTTAEAKQEFFNKIKNIEGVIVKPSNESEYNDFYTKIGRPASKDGYDFTGVLDTELLNKISDANTAVDEFKDIAYNLGLTDKQAKELVSHRMSAIKDAALKSEALKAEGEKKLKESWGPEYDIKLNSAKQVLKMYSEKYPEEVSAFVNGPMGNNPLAINMLAELGSLYKEQGHKGMQNTSTGVSSEEAKEMIREIQNNRSHPYNIDYHPEHNDALDKMTKLYEIAYR